MKYLYKVEVKHLFPEEKTEVYYENTLREAKRYKKTFFLEDVRIFKLTYELVDKEELK